MVKTTSIFYSPTGTEDRKCPFLPKTEQRTGNVPSSQKLIPFLPGYTHTHTHTHTHTQSSVAHGEAERLGAVGLRAQKVKSPSFPRGGPGLKPLIEP